MDNLKNELKKLKPIMTKILLTKVLPIISIIVLLVSAVYIMNYKDAKYEEGDLSNAPYVASQYTDSVTIDTDGKATTSMTAQELWDEMKKNKNRALQYLDGPEELLKLMNAQLVTQYLDTRKDPDKKIDWDSMNDVNSKEVQGIVKLKRADSNGNIATMTYADPETFQKYIDNYNTSGSEEDKKKALSHFTLEKSNFATGTASPITAGTTINIPNGLGSVHTYMGWQCITSTTSTQYKLREQAGMQFDSEGFGKINGRYVIACTTTYGTVGDYVDFYQVDGSIIPCIIGDIKNQNDTGCNEWGHLNGTCIIEFVVDKRTWYAGGEGSHVNPGTSSCHPEWNQNLTKAINGGSYFDNPNFGIDTIEENGTTSSMGLMKWPSDSTTITSFFGPRTAPLPGASTNHGAVDIGTSEGTNVYACEAGTVTVSTYAGNAGNMVTIDHGNGYTSTYMHNSVLKVSVGDTVEKGDVIALSGNTGNSTGPHLHFQIEYNGTKVDPLSFKYDNGMGDGNVGIGANSSGSSSSKYCAKVATWAETTKIITSDDPATDSSSSAKSTMTSTLVNYEKFVSGYTMPFDYLWAFLVIGEDKDFVLELADLVYNSEIEITIHDNLKVNTNVVVNTYTKKKKTDTTAVVTIKYGEESTAENTATATGSWTDEESTNYTVTETTVNKSNTLDIALTKANVWIVDYEQEFKIQTPQTTTTTNSQDLPDENYPASPNETTEGIDTYGHASSFLATKIAEFKENHAKVEGYITALTESIYYATVNKKKETTNSDQTTKYVSSPATIKEKTDKNAEEDNFVTILAKKEYKKAKSNILSVSSWLFEILEDNASTADMVDLTKHLLFKLTDDEDYEVKNPEKLFEAYDPDNFVDANQSGGNQNIIDIAKSKLGCSYVYGAAGPNTFDCSGLVYWVYGQAGITVPRTTDGYRSYHGTAKEISWEEAQPGDILIVHGEERGTSSGHAGIYLGNNEYIHSPQTGDVVKISNGAKEKFRHVFRFE